MSTCYDVEDCGCNFMGDEPEFCSMHWEAPQMLKALRDAYAHVTLLASGQGTPLSSAEMCDRLGEVMNRAESSTIHYREDDPDHL